MVVSLWYQCAHETKEFYFMTYTENPKFALVSEYKNVFFKVKFIITDHGKLLALKSL